MRLSILLTPCFLLLLLPLTPIDAANLETDRKEGPGKAYFYVAEGSKKCFYENTPASLPVTITYSSADNPGVSCTVSISDPRGRVVDSKEVTRTHYHGRLTYLTKQVGQHSVCASCPSSKWFGTSMIKWTISVDLGDTEINLAAAAKGHTMESNEQLVRILSQRLHYLHAENKYHEEQEAALHFSTETLGGRVVVCSLLQVLVIMISTVLAVMHLTRHFRAQKLVN